MTALISFELQKVWGKRSFQGLMALILILNVFFLWYLNRPGADEPSLSAYKAVCRDISDMTENEKLGYISKLKERADGLYLVEQVQTYSGQGGQSGKAMADQLKNSYPGIYEKYEELYRAGGYLDYTDSLTKERSLLDELYEEVLAVSGYGEYLESVQKNKEGLSSISIFQSAEEKSDFSSRNIAKSAEDHADLTAENICWFPSKGITMAAQSRTADLLILLSVFLFVGQLITEEKSRGLLTLTRAARKGMYADMGARLLAVLVHCTIVCLVLYGSCLLYAWGTAGTGDLSASVQSIAPYMESSLPLSLASFLILSLLTKICVVFLFGLLLSACAVYSCKNFMPSLTGMGFLGINWLLYILIPSYSGLSLLKHLSYFGLLQTDDLYGTYLNLNILGVPVSRLHCALAAAGVLILIHTAAVLLLFRHGSNLTLTRTAGRMRMPFHPHDSLFRHEGYKILIAGRGLLIVMAFAVLLGVNDLGKSYTPSSGEQYYQELMLSLEGELTGEKKDKIASEQARYDEAFAQIDRIDQMTADGEISEDAKDSLKEQWYSELAFYPWFQKVQAQYERICSDGGVFIYDTGYLYLFGQLDDSFLVDLLVISLCLSFAFSNVMAMEDSRGLWSLLCATRFGKKKIVSRKCLVCALICIGITILSWIFRFLSVSAVYPMGEITTGITNIPQYQDLPINLPVWAFLLLAVLCQITAVWIICAVVLLVSGWRKTYFQALFLAMLLLAAPLVLAQMGLGGMKWFSVWPLYGWTGMIG